jgi:hypothetical protein
VFDSRNALFLHIRKTGHAAVKGGVAATLEASGLAGGGGSGGKAAAKKERNRARRADQ